MSRFLNVQSSHWYRTTFEPRGAKWLVDLDEVWVKSVGRELVNDEVIGIGGSLAAVAAKAESGFGEIGMVHLRM